MRRREITHSLALRLAMLDIPDPMIERREELENSFAAFRDLFWPEISPTPLEVDRAVDALSIHIEAFFRGEIKKLLIHVQPGSAKTALVVLGSAWGIARDNTRRFLSSSNNDDRASEHSNWTRQIITSHAFRALWPLEFIPAECRANRFVFTTKGHREAVNFNGRLEGASGDCLIADDIQTQKDQSSPTTLERHLETFVGSWSNRIRDKRVGQSLVIGQRLGPYDVYNELRLLQNDWDVLALEGVKTVHGMATYYKRDGGRRVKVELPKVDTALSRDGRFIDDRHPNEPLSPRTPTRVIESMLPSVRYAQHQQSPIEASTEGARIHAFERARHLRSFAERMGTVDVASACIAAQRSGWKFSTGWDHGLDGGRECCVLIAWHDRLEELWGVGVYENPRRTSVLEDAQGVARLIESRLLQRRSIIQSVGDVGNMGKGSIGSDAAGSINANLSSVKIPGSNAPVLGFPIYTADKGAGSVEAGVELINDGYGSGAIFLDESCESLAIGHENWCDGEGYKDINDAFRYVAKPHLERWLGRREGLGGSAGG